MACGALSGVFSVPMSHKKNARFTWVIVHAITILYVSGISQQDNRAAVRNEKDLKFICADCCRGPCEELEVNNRMTRAFLKQSRCSSNRNLPVHIKLRLGIEIKKIISHNM